MLTLKLHRHWIDIVQLRFAPDGQHLVARYRNAGVAVWQTGTWVETAVLATGEYDFFNGFEIDASSRFAFITTGSGTLRAAFPSLNDLQPFGTDEHTYFDDFVLTRDGKTGIARRYPQKSGRVERVGLSISPNHEITVHWVSPADIWTSRDVEFFSDSERFVVAERTDPRVRDNRLRVHRWKDGELEQTIPCNQLAVEQVGFSPDGLHLAGRGGASIWVWATTALDRPPVKLKSGSRQQFTDLAFHPSSRFLAATSNDTTVKLYDTATWAIARTFTWNIGRLRSIAFSPDGLLAAAGSDKGQIVVWDVDA